MLTLKRCIFTYFPLYITQSGYKRPTPLKWLTLFHVEKLQFTDFYQKVLYKQFNQINVPCISFNYIQIPGIFSLLCVLNIRKCKQRF